MSAIRIHNIHKTFDKTCALCGVTFDIHAGEVVALLGPSGCGKSTLLSIIAGLQTPERGEIEWRGQVLGNLPTHQRQFGLMFQDYALFPHKNIFENIAFGLRMNNATPADIQARVAALLALVGLQDYAQRDVTTLSGGEQQRVALARALAPSPRLLMLDEPLGSLDRTLREELLNELKNILQRTGQTTLYVTHDQEEAFAVADRVVIMQNGIHVQIGRPETIYRQPGSPFVARFLGLENIYTGRAGGGVILTELGPLHAPRELSGEHTLLLRPDRFQIGASGPHQLEGRVARRTFRGNFCRLSITIQGASLRAEFPSWGKNIPPVGEKISLSYTPLESILFFDED